MWIEENQLNVVATSCFQDEIEKLKKIDRSHWSFSRTITVRTPLLLVFREFLKVKAGLYPSAFPQYNLSCLRPGGPVCSHVGPTLSSLL